MRASDLDLMIRVFSAPIPAQAHIVRGALQAAGIFAEVRGEERTPLAGALPIDQCFAEVWVREDDLPLAMEVVDHFRPHRGAGRLAIVEGPTGGELSVSRDWTCPRCGESSPPSFELCWSCGRDRRE